MRVGARDGAKGVGPLRLNPGCETRSVRSGVFPSETPVVAPTSIRCPVLPGSVVEGRRRAELPSRSTGMGGAEWTAQGRVTSRPLGAATLVVGLLPPVGRLRQRYLCGHALGRPRCDSRSHRHYADALPTPRGRAPPHAQHPQTRTHAPAPHPRGRAVPQPTPRGRALPRPTPRGRDPAPQRERHPPNTTRTRPHRPPPRGRVRAPVAIVGKKARAPELPHHQLPVHLWRSQTSPLAGPCLPFLLSPYDSRQTPRPPGPRPPRRAPVGSSFLNDDSVVETSPGATDRKGDPSEGRREDPEGPR